MRALAIAIVAATTLAACGSDGGSPSSTEPATSTPAGTDPAGTAAPSAPGTATTAPVTITHHYGSTTFDAAPQRIVSVDVQWTDVLVALEAPLVGVVLDPNAGGTGLYPWQTLPDSVERIAAGTSIPYEAIAALEPDLIVITYFAAEQSDYDQLSAIAPTIPLLAGDDAEVDPWQDIATAAGEVLGKQDEAATLIADLDQLSADIAAELPGLQGKTYALANYVPGDQIYVVADPNDGAATLFAQLGLSIEPDLLAIANGAGGRVSLSLEQISELDADLLIMLTNGADPDDIPGYDNLPAVQTGAVALLDLPTVIGLNTPTPLSIPYSLDAVRAALEAAAG